MTYAWLYWDPNRFIFTVPIIDRPIAWYGFFFVIGFIIGYFMMVKMLKTTLRHTQYVADRDVESWDLLVGMICSDKLPETPQQKTILAYFSEKTKAALRKIQKGVTPSKEHKKMIINSINEALSDPASTITRENLDTCFPNAIYSLKDLAMYLTDRLTWFVIAGTLIGARLGHVFFYDWSKYNNHPVDILKIWEGGLASHGGAIGVFTAIILYMFFIRKKFPELRFYSMLDNIVVPTALVAFFIRIGNFFNQEIIGTETDVPWAVIFGSPYDGSGVFPRHPAQLYEAACYLITFFVLGWMWIKKRELLKRGYLTGLFFVLVFTSRFFVEFIKVSQGGIADDTFLQTGQLLSIPFILFGLWLMFRPKLPMRS